jgi:hypothetical protein
MEPDPFLTPFAHGGSFIGRRALRAHLRALTEEGGARVLVVDGPRGSGKSFTLQLITHLSVQLQTFSVAAINLEGEALDAIAPGDVAHSIALQMGADASAMPPPDEAASRWSLDLRDWLLGEARRHGTAWWFVFDGFGPEDVPFETRDFIRHLVVAAHQATTTLRIVLLGWSEALVPMNIRAHVLRETIEPIGQADLRQFLQELSHAGVLPLDARGVEEVVTAIQNAATESGSGLVIVAAEAVRRLRYSGATVD